MQISMFDGTKRFKITKPIRLIQLFAGYGSQALGLKYLGVPYEDYKICEWAVKSIQAYKDLHFPNDNCDYSRMLTKEELIDFLTKRGISANYNEPMTREQIIRLGETKQKQIFNNILATHNLVSVCNVKGEDLEIHNTEEYTYIMTYSFPCQDLSSAGKGLGMEKGSGTRSGLLWEVERILTEIKESGGELPQVLIMENVPEVIGTNNIKHFAKWVEFLDNLGYKSKWECLNAKNYGIPQNRDRCFMVSVLGDYYYEMPKPIKLELRLKDMLEDKVDESFYLSEKTVQMFEEHTKKKQAQGCGFKFAPTGGWYAHCITTREGQRTDDNFIKEGLIFNKKKIKCVSDISTTIQAHYSKGITSFEKQFDTGVLEVNERN